MKVLIDSVYVNNGGGRILLDLLIQNITSKKIKADYLFDNRYTSNYTKSKLSYFNNFLKRYLFYFFNQSKYDIIFTFGNLPPLIKGKKNITYFHQPLFINSNSSNNLKTRFLIYLKKKYIKFYLRNTDIWIVQTQNVKFKLQKTFNIKSEILVHPFYNELIFEKFTKKDAFLYPSKAYPHKNHKILIEGFCKYYNVYNKGELIVTVGNENDKILDLIKSKIKLGYPIKNIGFVNQEELREQYLKAKFVIFPSENESFGLGLIEAVLMKCKVIAPDLDYVKDVISSSIKIKNLTEKGIFESLSEANTNYTKDSELLAKNDINKIIKLLNGK
jgi:hypothetical protein